MTEELELQLVKEFPTLYKNYRGDPKHTCMAWGMTCEDGWFPLVYAASAALEHLNSFIELEEEKIVAAQLKQKFGGLRIYIEAYPVDDKIKKLMEAIIRAAERASFHICEVCGDGGSVSGKGWIQTLCQTHRDL